VQGWGDGAVVALMGCAGKQNGPDE
jgi:hypothetical protein